MDASLLTSTSISSTMSRICYVHGAKVRYCSCAACIAYRANIESIQKAAEAATKEAEFEKWVKSHVQVLRSFRPGTHIHKSEFKPFLGARWP